MTTPHIVYLFVYGGATYVEVMDGSKLLIKNRVLIYRQELFIFFPGSQEFYLGQIHYT